MHQQITHSENNKKKTVPTTTYLPNKIMIRRNRQKERTYKIYGKMSKIYAQNCIYIYMYIYLCYTIHNIMRKCETVRCSHGPGREI